MKTPTPFTTPVYPSLRTSVLLLFALVCFALVQNTQAVSPPPDGGYPNGNTAEGQSALAGLTTGFYNSAFGILSLFSNGSAGFNTGVGAGALLANTAGSQNTATGAGALLANTTGIGNMANGCYALVDNTTGNYNTANGFNILSGNTTGSFNTAIGTTALFFNTTGDDNTAMGDSALDRNTTGSSNVALGASAGHNVHTSNNVICVGADVPGIDVSNTCFIGNIRDVSTQNADAIPVVIDSAGQLGTASSSAKFKKEIKPMDSASEAILALKPVTFHYKGDKTGTPQFGLIAEDVANVNPNLVVRNKSGDIYTVRYDAVNAMLLNEFLKEHRTVQEQEATIARLQAQIKTLSAGLQKVSAQLELIKPAPRTVLNH